MRGLGSTAVRQDRHPHRRHSHRLSVRLPAGACMVFPLVMPSLTPPPSPAAALCSPLPWPAPLPSPRACACRRLPPRHEQRACSGVLLQHAAQPSLWAVITHGCARRQAHCGALTRTHTCSCHMPRCSGSREHTTPSFRWCEEGGRDAQFAARDGPAVQNPWPPVAWAGALLVKHLTRVNSGSAKQHKGGAGRAGSAT